MSEWAVPSGMTPQDNPRQPKDGIQDLVQRFTAFRVEVRDKFNNLLKQAGVRVLPEGLVIEKDLTVTGTLNVTQSADITGTTHIGGATDIDGTLNVDAAATFGGAMAITGTLSLPAGIIGNDALANPVEPADFRTTNYSGNFAVSTSWTSQATNTLTVPAGFTRALVTATAYLLAYTVSSVTRFYARATIAGDVGDPAQSGVPSAVGAYESMQATHSQLVAGLVGGGTFTVTADIRSTVAQGAHANNDAAISGTVLWLR